MRTSLAALMIGLGGAAYAEAPLSAIDWLSDSVANPAPRVVTPGEEVGPAAIEQIEVTALDATVPDVAGLLPPTATGLPRALWGPASAEDVTARIEAVPRGLSPALNQLLVTVLLAEANAPLGGDNDSVLLARVDRLLEIGSLDRALALLDRAGPDTPERFRRYFDVALLKGREQEACARLRARPEISPTYPARIFCLARGGDWQAAAVTLETANSLGILTPEEDLLLARFLDPEILPDEDIAPDRRTPTPLTFRMLEAVGEPLPTTGLPLAFAWADMRETRGWKARLDAGERLARAGVLSPNQLTGLYLERRPSASGGVWERASAIQALETGLAAGDTDAVASALPTAWEQMHASNLHHVLAAQYGAELAALGLEGEAGRVARTLGLLSPGYAQVAAKSINDSFVIALALGIPETAIAQTDQAFAVRQGFTEPLPDGALRQLVDGGRTGEAILKAITLFAEGADGDVDGVSQAIAALRALGLDDAARRAALELLLADQPV
ncbi:MAG: hypothetical protein AAGA87_17600 [Pseudomonadota bacterium]